MKKYLLILSLAVLASATIVSCKKDDDDDGSAVVKASLIKTISVNYGTDTEGWEFIYNADSTISHIKNTYNDAQVDDILFDYTVAGKLTITKEDTDTEYEIDAKGRITKEIWDATSWASYTYNSDGYLTQISEYWSDANHVKYAVDITNGNVTKHTRYDDAGTITRYKTFTYTSGDNVNDIQQTNALDSNWKTIGGLFGKSSGKLVDYLEYWTPGDEANKSRTTITYTFDSKNRPATITRSGADWSEAYSYTYYE